MTCCSLFVSERHEDPAVKIKFDLASKVKLTMTFPVRAYLGNGPPLGTILEVSDITRIVMDKK